MKLRILLLLEAVYCHKLGLPGSAGLCDRYDEWVTRDGPKAEG